MVDQIHVVSCTGHRMGKTGETLGFGEDSWIPSFPGVDVPLASKLKVLLWPGRRCLTDNQQVWWHLQKNNVMKREDTFP